MRREQAISYNGWGDRIFYYINGWEERKSYCNGCGERTSYYNQWGERTS